MATVTQFWSPGTSCYQQFGTTVDWVWGLGDGDYYWGFSVRPEFLHVIVSLEAPITSGSAGKADDSNQITTLTVAIDGDRFAKAGTVIGGGDFIRFTAIKVTTP